MPWGVEGTAGVEGIRAAGIPGEDTLGAEFETGGIVLDTRGTDCDVAGGTRGTDTDGALAMLSPRVRPGTVRRAPWIAERSPDSRGSPTFLLPGRPNDEFPGLSITFSYQYL